MRKSWRPVLALMLGALLASLTGPEALAQGMYTPQACDAAGVDCCDPCTRGGPRCYGSVEGLLWWLDGDSVPPLVTRDDLGDGSLASPTVAVLLSDEVNTSEYGGLRVTLGQWLDDARSSALEVSYFFIAESPQSLPFAADGSDNAPSLFQPFFNVTAGQPDAAFVAGPGQVGGIFVEFGQRLTGAELNARTLAGQGRRFQLDLLAGFRFLALDEHLDIFTSSIDAFDTLNLQEFQSFASRNRFYGGQIGADLRYVGDLCWVSGLVKLAIGGSHQQTDISGNAVDNIVGASGPATLLAQATNIGVHERGRFVFVPEFGLTFGLRLCEHVDLTVGYTFIWISSVLRPGSAIDLNTTIPVIGDPPPSPTNPAFCFHGDDFWAQGFNFGVQMTY